MTIQKLDQNTEGKDYIIGDIHGHGALLQGVIAQLQPQDRLFVVGDLFDRGQSPVEVFQSLRAIDAYVVRGNHEDMLLCALSTHASLADIWHFLSNGGYWILNHVQDRNTLKTFVRRLDKDSSDAEAQARVYQLFTSAEKINELDEIIQYILSLPYIIHVGTAERAFGICHADLPLSDHELKTMYENNGTMTPERIEHLTWARATGKDGPKLASPGERTAQSMIIYCGHSILTEAADAVRIETNHINLDGGAYRHDYFILVNHTDRSAQIIGLDEDAMEIDENFDLHQAAAQHIERHLRCLPLPDDATPEEKLLHHLSIIQHAMDHPKFKTSRGKIQIKYLTLANSMTKLYESYQHWIQDPQQYGERLQQDLDHCKTLIYRARSVANFDTGVFLPTTVEMQISINIENNLEAMQDILSALLLLNFSSK